MEYKYAHAMTANDSLHPMRNDVGIEEAKLSASCGRNSEAEAQ